MRPGGRSRQRRPARRLALLPIGLLAGVCVAFWVLGGSIGGVAEDLQERARTSSAKWTTSSLFDSSSSWRANLPPLPFSFLDSDRANREALIDSIRLFRDHYETDWPVDKWRSAREHTTKALEDLVGCLAMRSCGRNQARVVVGGSFHFGNSQSGHLSGEDIWARSSIDTFRSLGYTVLFAYKPLEVLAMHQSFGSLIVAAIMEGGDIADCLRSGIPKPINAKEALNDREFVVLDLESRDGRAKLDELREVHGLSEIPEGGKINKDGTRQAYGWKKLEGPGGNDGMWGDFKCIKREGFEEGLPIWKVFAFHFWPNAAHTLGGKWTVSPENYGSNFYLGYSMESYCKARPYVPHELRADRSFILGKQAKYFEEKTSVYNKNNRTFATISEALHLEFHAAVGDPGSSIPEEGITNVGKLPLAEFYDHLAKSKMLIGQGHPLTSPAPYDALCLGVPFINPLLGWDKEDPNRREAWYTQHDGLKMIEEPYVYHVRKGDARELQEAVARAREAKIERFIPPDMTLEANAARHQLLLDTDWLSRARTIIETKEKPDAFWKTLLL